MQVRNRKDLCSARRQTRSYIGADNEAAQRVDTRQMRVLTVSFVVEKLSQSSYWQHKLHTYSEHVEAVRNK